MQQQSIRALAIKAQERIRGNTPCNKDATSAEKACNNDDSEKRRLLHRELHLSAAELVLEVAHELGLNHSLALGFFNSISAAPMRSSSIIRDKINPAKASIN